MNSFKSTASKVLELEKRLDNSLIQSGMNVSKIAQVFENETLSAGENVYMITSVLGNKNSKNVVLQGELKFLSSNLSEKVEIGVILMLDGYRIYSEKREVSGSVYSWNILETLSISSGETQELQLVVTADAEIGFDGYKFFLWGYGDELGLVESSVEPKLSATSKNGRVVISVVVGNLCYRYFGLGLSENLSLDDFSYFGKLKQIESIFVLNPSDNEEIILYNFYIDEENTLKVFNGKTETLTDATPIEICKNINAVSVCEMKDSKVLVVMADGKQLKMTTFNGDECDVIVKIRDFKENISEVSLIRDCDSTQFLIVALEDGRNYLLSSTTEITSQDKHSVIKFVSEIEFL